MTKKIKKKHPKGGHIMQHNLIIGNVARITKVEGTNKAYITVADNENRKDPSDPTGKRYVQHTNFITLQAFIPEGLNISKGDLLAATYVQRTYTTRDGKFATANDVTRLNVTIRSPKRKNNDSAQEPAAPKAAEPDQTKALENAMTDPEAEMLAAMGDLGAMLPGICPAM